MTLQGCKSFLLGFDGCIKIDRGNVKEGKRANDAAWHCTQACTPSLELGASKWSLLLSRGRRSLSRGHFCRNSHENTLLHSFTGKEAHAGRSQGDFTGSREGANGAGEIKRSNKLKQHQSEWAVRWILPRLSSGGLFLIKSSPCPCNI